jgi:calcineurin-like phosphoesterase family protein
MTTWFTSDLHLGHTNILKYCNRPWATTIEMDDALIANWNAVVAPDDDVYNLGDLAVCTTDSYAEDCIRRLNGRHHFVQGNHDEAAYRLWFAGFKFASWADGYYEIEVEGQRIVLCYYAMREWPHNLRGVWHLFGHTHGLLRSFGKSVDVGVDNVCEVLLWHPSDGALDFGAGDLAARQALYRPVSFAELKAFMDRQPIGPHPKFDKHPGVVA